MSAPLGRSVVVVPGAAPPPAWSDCERVVVDGDLLADPARLESAVDLLHRAWVGRRPVVVELGVDDGDLAEPDTSTLPPWRLGGRFTFLRERLHHLVWANSYDARRDPPMWWWAIKAEAAGARRGGSADVILPDGREAYVDGGPREPLDSPYPVVHAETVALGRLHPIPPPTLPPAGLAPDQEEAVAHRAGPARIIAPAGSGKTRVLVARLRHLLDERGIEPEIVCALAYNRRAAEEMRARVGRRLEVRTIHSLGWEVLQSTRGRLTLLDERRVRRRLEPLVQAPPRPNTDVIGPYLEALGEVRIALRPPEEVEASRDDVPGLTALYDRYRRTLAERGEADHDEQVFGAIEALAADPALRRAWQRRCRHVLVDEFQDLTPAYLLLIRLVASPGLQVFGVGDDDQVIYGYAGADPGFLIDFDELFPGAGSHALEVNYRCPQRVVTASTRLLAHNRRRVSKTIVAGPAAAPAEDALEVSAHPGPRLGAEACGVVADWIAQGVDPRTMAVLSRVNSALLPVRAALADAGIGFVSPIGPGLLDRTVMRAALAWVRIALAPDRIARRDLMEAVRRPSRGLTRLTSELVGGRRWMAVDELAKLGLDLTGQRAERWDLLCDDITVVSSAVETSERLLDALAFEVGLDRAASALDAGRTRADRSAQTDDLRALRRAAVLHPRTDTFEEWLRGVLSRPSDPGGVTLTTIHRVKGLEWDRVVLFGADRGTMPHDLAEDVEEERRIFHVALTRGRHKVVVMCDERRPSRFIAEMEGRVAPVEEAPAEVAPLGVDRHGPLSGPPADPELVARLKEWRLATARAHNLPAYMVLHDATLEEIAARRPATERELARVQGIGPAKLEAYGDDLLALCAEG